MSLYLDNEEIRPNWAFTLYFSLMFCLYTNTYIQLFAQLAIIVYVVLQYTDIKTIYIEKSNAKNMIFYLCWFGGLTFAFYLSTKFWAYSSYEGSKTLLSIFRIFVIGFIIFLYTDSRERIYSVLQSFIIATAVMGVVAIVTSVVMGYGFGNTMFGSAIGQHRNQIGAVAVPMIFICYFLNREFSFRYGKLLSVYFLVLALMTGSLTTMMQIAGTAALIVILTSENMYRTIKRIIIFAVLALLIILVIRNIPYFNELLWTRLINVFQTLSGTNDYADVSALGRQSYKEIAFTMFLNKPLLGYGLDGFYCYLRDANIMINGYRLNEVYSHCNYAELAADLGILGLAIWYIPVLTILKRIWKSRKFRVWSSIVAAIFLIMIITDYSRIPWQTHMVMYLWFIIIIICRDESEAFLNEQNKDN